MASTKPRQKSSQTKKAAKPTGPIIRFWGVRGSIATPGVSTVKFGGNTSCVELLAGEDRLVFDAGSGLRGLGLELAREQNAKLTIVLSHYHWDHLLGFPFFIPMFKPDSVIDVFGEQKDKGGPLEALQRQFSDPSFPVVFSTLPSKLAFHQVAAGDKFSAGAIEIEVGRLNHPQGALCYRATVGKKKIVYASDHEHDGEGDKALIEFARGADVLIYDAMYSDESYAQGKKGWGHSTWQEGVRVAKSAKVKSLYLFHHDPMNDDATLSTIERKAKKLFAPTTVAREGSKIVL